MQKFTLGRSDVEVSQWCLGTMTYGNQTSQEDADRQLSRAMAAGINFVDTAEMYPVNPVHKDTVGRSEEVIGNWIEANGRPDDMVIATKISGPNGGFVREGAGFSGAAIRGAVEDSLRRMKTDVIDLYQLHWPNRGSYMFRQNWAFDPSGQKGHDVLGHMDEVLGAVGELIAEGKIRAFGLSNESCWGTTRWIDRAAATGGPRVASVQNEYSLMCRLYDTDMAEMSVHEDVTLLSYSPLACGVLTGKYQNGAVPKDSRLTLAPDLGGRKSERLFDVAQAYLDIAAKNGLDPVHMAMAWQMSRPFAVCPIFGATSDAQLEHLLGGVGLVLSDEVLTEIAVAHKANPMPY